MIKKQAYVIISIILSLSLLLCGCGSPAAKPEESAKSAGLFSGMTVPDAAEKTVAPGTADKAPERDYLAPGRYFSRQARDTVKYSDMTGGSWSAQEIDRLCEQLLEAGRSGSIARFHAACTAVEDAIYGIYTAYALADIRSSADVNDASAREDAGELIELYYQLSSGYTDAVCQLAEEGCALLDTEFSAEYIASLADYDEDASARELEHLRRETELMDEYETLVSADAPDTDAIGRVYVELVEVRREIARLNGYDSYADYAYENVFSRDYTPKDAQKIWNIAQTELVPILVAYSQEISNAMDRTYYSTDLDCSEEAVLSALEKGASGMSPEVEAACRYMLDNGLYDIRYSESKLDSGFTVYLPDYGVPFIFNSPYGYYQDYTDMFHEFGHFLSYFYTGSDAVYGVSDYDLSELQSQGMEVMFMGLYDDIFGSLADDMRAQTAAGLINSVIYGAMYDQFQQEVYGESDLTPERVNEIYAKLYESYGWETYDGYEYEWMWVIHNFEDPFYYISYAVSALPALELMARQQDSPADALDTYLRIASLDSELYYLSEALEIAGLENMLETGSADDVCLRLLYSGILDVE